MPAVGDEAMNGMHADCLTRWVVPAGGKASSEADVEAYVGWIPSAVGVEAWMARFPIRNVNAHRSETVEPGSRNSSAAAIYGLNVTDEDVILCRVRPYGHKAEMDVWMSHVAEYCDCEVSSRERNLMLNGMAPQQLQEVQMNMQH